MQWKKLSKGRMGPKEMSCIRGGEPQVGLQTTIVLLFQFGPLEFGGVHTPLPHDTSCFEVPFKKNEMLTWAGILGYSLAPLECATTSKTSP